MKALLKLCFCAALASTASAAPNGNIYDWYDLAQQHRLAGGEIVVLDGGPVLKVENTNSSPLTVALFQIDDPPVSNSIYQIRGQVKYDQVQGDGYLEMWNVFSSANPGQLEDRFFSRTLANSGEMQKVSGSSPWRSFTLPFNSTGAPGRSKRIELNLFLPGRGIVFIRPLMLSSADIGFGSAGPSASAWWTDRQGGLIGGISGVLFGCCGALVGCLAALGKGRRFVLAIHGVLVGVGILSLIAGLLALACRQPYAVWYMLLLTGVLLTAIFGVNIPLILKRYHDLELRRMAAVDTLR